MMAATPRIRRLTRGELARRSGVNIETIRYFERIGIIPAPSRTEGGHRIYDEGDIRALAFIRQARGFGFTQAEVREILNLGGPGKACCDEVRKIAVRHLENVRSKIAGLIRIERLLASTVEQCSGGHVPECPVINMLDSGSAASGRS